MTTLYSAEIWTVVAINMILPLFHGVKPLIIVMAVYTCTFEPLRPIKLLKFGRAALGGGCGV
jgi:hypothetical protein